MEKITKKEKKLIRALSRKQSNVQKNNNTKKKTKTIRSRNGPQFYNNVVNKGLGYAFSKNPHTEGFARVYADPFLQNSVSIPTFPPVIVERHQSYCRGTGIINSNGAGWVCVIPAAMMTNDTNGVFFSNQEGSPSSIQQVFDGDPNPTAFGFATSTSQFSWSRFNTQTEGNGIPITGRIVALGLRVRYTGTQLNMSGVSYGCEIRPAGASLNGYTGEEITKCSGYKQHMFNRSWFCITRMIEDQNDLLFQKYDDENHCFVYDFDSTGMAQVPATADAYARQGIAITGYPGENFEWEVRCHFEVQGQALNRNMSIPSDTEGVGRVVSSFKNLRSKDSTTVDHNVGGNSSTLGKLIGDGEILSTTAELIAAFL